MTDEAKMPELPNTENMRELLALVEPEIGWPEVAFKALADITILCNLIESKSIVVSAGEEEAIQRLSRYYGQMPSDDYEYLDNYIRGRSPTPADKATDAGDFYNATTEEALRIIESAFRLLKQNGVESNYGVTDAAIKQIRLNSQPHPPAVALDETIELSDLLKFEHLTPDSTDNDLRSLGLACLHRLPHLRAALTTDNADLREVREILEKYRSDWRYRAGSVEPIDKVLAILDSMMKREG